MIKLIILALTIFIAIRVGRIIRKGIMTFKVQNSNFDNLSNDNSFKTNKIEDAEFEDITDDDDKL